jgi:hypothetical protein
MASATKPKSSTPAHSSQRAGNLLDRYQANLNPERTNALGDFETGAESYWNATRNLRDYSDRLRGESRAHEKELQSGQIKGQIATAGIAAGAQTKTAQIGANASTKQTKMSSDTERYLGRLNLEGTKYQVDGSVKSSRIGADAQVATAKIGADSDRYAADIGLKQALAGYGSQERIAAGQQSGENYRTGLNLAGSLLMNQQDNYTARSGQLYDYAARIGQAQWQAPTVNDIRYWS